MTAYNALFWFINHIDHSSMSYSIWVFFFLVCLTLTVPCGCPSLAWLGPQCVCVCVGWGLHPRNILPRVYIYICSGSMCLQRWSRSSLGPSGKLAAVIKFDMKERMEGGGSLKRSTEWWDKKRKEHRERQSKRRWETLDEMGLNKFSDGGKWFM